MAGAAHGVALWYAFSVEPTETQQKGAQNSLLTTWSKGCPLSKALIPCRVLPLPFSKALCHSHEVAPLLLPPACNSCTASFKALGVDSPSGVPRGPESSHPAASPAHLLMQIPNGHGSSIRAVSPLSSLLLPEAAWIVVTQQTTGLAPAPALGSGSTSLPQESFLDHPMKSGHALSTLPCFLHSS